MIYGYARVSTKGQARDGNSLEAQELALRSAGAVEIFSESYTGTERHRPELDKLISNLQSGDMLIVTKLDRIARNTKDGIEIIDYLIDKGCSLRILNMGLFDNTPTGKLMRTVMLAFAEFERDMIIQRTAEGKAIARQREGYKEGRPYIEIEDFDTYAKYFETKRYSAKEICVKLGISETTFFRRLKEYRGKEFKEEVESQKFRKIKKGWFK